MGNITVKIIGADKFAKEQSIIIKNLVERQIKRIAKLTEDVIREKIRESVQRVGSTGNLANSFYAEKILDGWGVGNINYLNKNAPYWRHVNFGSQAIGANWQHRVPTGGFSPGEPKPLAGASGSRWQVGGANYSFIPTKPIAPLNYIAKTLQELNIIVRRGLSEAK